jgi:predicted nuclease with TOPRIM domain
MGTAPQQNPGSTILCMICGRENPTERQYCYNCKQKLHDPIMDKMRAALRAVQVENEQLRQQLEPIQTENQQLREQLEPVQTENQKLRDEIEPLKGELATIKATSFPPEHVEDLNSKLEAATAEAATHASHAETLKDKWNFAEAKAKDLEAKLAAKAKELEDFIKKHSGTNPIPYLKSIVAFITLLGSLAGYGTGRYVRPTSTDSGDKVRQMMAQVADAQQQIGNLKSSLNAANAKADQAQNQSKADLDSASQKNSDLSTHQQQLQHQLNDANQKASIAAQNQKQLKQDLDTANHKISALTASEQQLQHQLADANGQKVSTNQTVVQLNAEIAKLHAQIAPKGSLVWSGNLTGKRTINVKNGAPDFGALSGALPQKLCRVSTQDARVKIKNRPSKSHLNDLSFEVSGSGLLKVQIDWEISQ